MLTCARCEQNFRLFRHARSSWQKENKNICLMNSKFKKNQNKIKKLWNFLGSNMLKCARCDENFVLKWDRTGSCKDFVIFLSFFFKFTIHRAVLWRSNPVNMLKIWFRTKLIRFWDLRDQMYTKKIWGIMSILCGNLRDQKHTFSLSAQSQWHSIQV